MSGPSLAERSMIERRLMESMANLAEARAICSHWTAEATKAGILGASAPAEPSAEKSAEDRLNATANAKGCETYDPRDDEVWPDGQGGFAYVDRSAYQPTQPLHSTLAASVIVPAATPIVDRLLAAWCAFRSTPQTAGEHEQAARRVSVGPR
jgi:hypothetical protein